MLATASITADAVAVTTVSKTSVSVIETELPTFVGRHKGLFRRQNGGDLNCMYDSYRFDNYVRSRAAARSCKKDKKNYRPYRQTGSVIKSITESASYDELVEAQRQAEFSAMQTELRRVMAHPLTQIKQVLNPQL